jgi:hypothetical protein
MTPKSRYRYDAERRERDFRTRYLGGFTGLLFRALGGDARPLCDLLLSDKRLSADDRDGLAWLIDKKMQHAPKGRRTGRARGPWYDAAWEVYDLVRARRKAEQAERAIVGRQRLPKGRLDQLILEAVRDVGNRRPGVLDADRDAPGIRKMLDR